MSKLSPICFVSVSSVTRMRYCLPSITAVENPSFTPVMEMLFLVLIVTDGSGILTGGSSSSPEPVSVAISFGWLCSPFFG